MKHNFYQEDIESDDDMAQLEEDSEWSDWEEDEELALNLINEGWKATLLNNYLVEKFCRKVVAVSIFDYKIKIKKKEFNIKFSF